MSLVSTSENFCTICGLCCDGAIFDHGKLGADEVDVSRAAGLDIFDRSDGPAFRITCAQLSGTRCMVYDMRPRTCRKYRCELLRNVEEGEVAISAAIERITHTRELVDKIVEGLTDGETLTEARSRWLRSPPGWWKGNSSAGQFRLEMTMLNLLLDRHFRSKKKRIMIGDEGADGELTGR